jgi:hypothetical protein
VGKGILGEENAKTKEREEWYVVCLEWGKLVNYHLLQDLKDFSVKGHMVNILGFVGSMVSAAKI